MAGPIIVAVMILAFIVYIYRYYIPHFKRPTNNALMPNATVVDISTVKERNYKNTRLKTTVSFSDGSEYTTYSSKSKTEGIFPMRYVDRDYQQVIANRAISIHNKKCGITYTVASPQMTENRYTDNTNRGTQSRNINDSYQTAEIKRSNNTYERTITLCGNCGAEIPLGSKFCNQCGERIGEDSKEYCKYCGLLLDDDAVFCTNCGHKR